jgi:hypothetical protein
LNVTDCPEFDGFCEETKVVVVGTVTGTVTVYDGTTALKTVALSGGAAKFTTSTLTSGSHSITATYNGNANFIGSSASLTQTVN